MKPATKIFCAAIFAIATTGLSVELNPLFQDNAVLQCDRQVPVWGTAREGEKITVSFAGQEVSTTATNGAWEIWVRPMNTSHIAQTLTVRGDNTRAITNVVVGEV